MPHDEVSARDRSPTDASPNRVANALPIQPRQKRTPSLDAESATVRQIAESLGETALQAVSHIRQIVAVLGEIESLALLAQTDRVEQTGGVLILNGTRRRTPGGVFFKFAREALSPEQVKKIFVSRDEWRRRRSRCVPPQVSNVTFYENCTLTLDLKLGEAVYSEIAVDGYEFEIAVTIPSSYEVDDGLRAKIENVALAVYWGVDEELGIVTRSIRDAAAPTLGRLEL